MTAQKKARKCERVGKILNHYQQALYQMSKIDKHFVSDIDKTLAQFDAAHAKSSAQQVEYDKYQRIYQLRDTPTESVSSELRSKFINKNPRGSHGDFYL